MSDENNADTWGDHVVDVAAVLSIGTLAWAPTSAAMAAALAGAISSVAVGKRWAGRRKA